MFLLDINGIVDQIKCGMLFYADADDMKINYKVGYLKKLLILQRNNEKLNTFMIIRYPA